jgi:hypothetical protein
VRKLVIAVFLLLFLGSLLFFLGLRQGANENLFLFKGRVISVSKTTVAYKDSILVTILEEETGNPLPLYVTNKTEVLSELNNPVSRTSLSESMIIEVAGTPIEGGIEATKVNIIDTAALQGYL